MMVEGGRAMTVTPHIDWNKLDPGTRDELDAEFLAELRTLAPPGLTEEGVQAYLDYRHEWPEASLTTFAEGQVLSMLHRYEDPRRVPDPVEIEEHLDPLERFGARRLHMTNAETYSALIFALIFGGVLALILALILT